jgi:UDP-N-acetyl-2-amino-2-deoxyglucuronate dehydrogenase
MKALNREEMKPDMTEQLRFGIVGCGVIGALHAKAISSLPDAQFVSVVDVIPERAHRLAQEYSVTPYVDTREMYANEHLDVVTICTPSGMHGAHAIEAMLAGCHVIVEKPMEITLANIEKMLHVQQETGRKMAVISQHRFDSATQQVHKLVEEQAFGKLVLGNAIIPWWRSQQYYNSGAWRGTWELDGGGVLMNQSIHSIDLLQWLMGRVKSIYAYTDTLAHRMETEDVAVAVLRFASGAVGTIAATTSGYPGTGTRIAIYGDKGTAVIESDKLKDLHLARDQSEKVGSYGGVKPSPTATDPGKTGASDPGAIGTDTHALQIEDMIRAIHENGTPLVDGNEARHPVEIILGIYESARTGKEVML